MIVTIDTNIFYQSLYSRNGVSFKIYELIRKNEIELAISIPVFMEYQDVLLRESSLNNFNLSKKEIMHFLDFIAYISIPIKIDYLLRPNLRDENDNIFIELAFASDSRYLITKNIKDYKFNTDLILDNFEVIDPADFYRIWRKNHEN